MNIDHRYAETLNSVMIAAGRGVIGIRLQDPLLNTNRKALPGQKTLPMV